ncbi:MAG: hypothetical protein NC926_07995 [Candidatus Omnitrophica bacterium]|nr:hypothetical protein [Candidatus Omnitrophota bacterium]
MNEIIKFYCDAFENLDEGKDISSSYSYYLLGKISYFDLDNIFVDGDGKLFFKNEINNFEGYKSIFKDMDEKFFKEYDYVVIEKIANYYFVNGHINYVDVNKRLYIYFLVFHYLYKNLSNLFYSINSIKSAIKSFMNFGEWYNLYKKFIELFNRVYDFYKNDVEFKKYIEGVENYGYKVE